MATLDVSPVERALPKDAQYIPSYFRDWQVPIICCLINMVWLIIEGTAYHAAP